MIHNIVDTDTHFIIDSSTRLVKNETETKSMLVQYDHNSEKFTFRVPRKIDEHDLTNCNVVRVHFINLDKSKRPAYEGVDDITESLGECEEDDECVTCSWLVPDRATQVAGFLHFVIQFACVNKETNKVLYSWNTAKYTGITIADGIKNDESYVTEHNDALTELENKLKATCVVSAEQTTTSTDDEGENVWTVTFANGDERPFIVRNGSKGEKGDTSLVGSIETINKEPLHFFVGTQAEYEALNNADKQNLFAIISDDTTAETIENAINVLQERCDAFADGTVIVGKALCDSEGNSIVETYATKDSIVGFPEPTYKPVTIENYNSISSKGYYYFEIVFNDGTHYHLGMLYWDGKSQTRTWIMQPDLWEYYLNISDYGKVTLMNSDKEIQDDLSKRIRVARLYKI